MAIPQFADISAFQPENIDWKTYRAWAASFDGVARISMKSTEGVGFTDPHFHEYRNGALAAGVDRCIYYHFARPDLGNSPEAEADYQHSVVGSVRDGDILMLDYEVTKPQATADWMYRWLARQEANYGGKLPTPYASSAYILEHLQDARLSRYPLTLANWTYNPSARPACPKPWSAYTYLQFTDQDRVIPGIPGNVDANVFLGSEQGETMQLPAGYSSYFTITDDQHIHCKSKNADLVLGHLAYWLQHDGIFRLPLLSEFRVAQWPAVSFQIYEGAIVAYDPQRQLDHPPTNDACYLVHLDGGPGQAMIAKPLVVSLQQQIDDLKAQLANQQDNSALQAKLTAYEQAVAQVEATLTALPK